MFELGELVCTREKGPPAQGIVRACYEPDFYNWAQAQKSKPRSTHIDQFDTTENYYTVEFPEPIRTLTVDDVMSEFGWQREEATQFVETLPKYTYLDFPEQYLERIV